MKSLFDIKTELLNELPHHNLVITAPTGAGKSTQIPQWLIHTHKVLMIQPRRIATKSLAHRIAEELKSPIGKTVGYSVRQDQCYSKQSRLIMVTPGIALRIIHGKNLDDFDVIIFDEFHERGLEQDLLLALCRQRNKRIIILSATIAAPRIFKQS